MQRTHVEQGTILPPKPYSATADKSVCNAPLPKQVLRRYILFMRKGSAVCCGFCLAYYLASLERSALTAKNSVPHCFLNAVTLSFCKNAKLSFHYPDCYSDFPSEPPCNITYSAQ